MSRTPRFRPGQVVDHEGDRGVVVANISAGLFSDGYPRKDWAYLERGVLVEFGLSGLVHFPEVAEDLLLITE